MYVTRRQMQSVFNRYYQQNNTDISFIDAAKKLFVLGQCTHQKPAVGCQPPWQPMTDADFFAAVDCTPIDIGKMLNADNQELNIHEQDIIPDGSDIFVYMNFDHYHGLYHSQDFIEINYIYSGSCALLFEEKTIPLSQGDFIIIGPNAHRNHICHKDLKMVSISLRGSTFLNTFFSLLSQANLLSNFFRHILFRENANYLIFHTSGSTEIKSIIQHLYLENNYGNRSYLNHCSIGWMNILFSAVLNNCDQAGQMYINDMDSNFFQILHYIEENFRTLTLEELAAHFHYTVTYMSHYVRQNFDQNYSALIKQMKLTEAKKLLLQTEMSIEEIAHNVGYHSADHFSRMFKKEYGTSPQMFRLTRKQTASASLIYP